jgi:hypothetical protein
MVREAMKPGLRYLAIAGAIVLSDQAMYLTSITMFADGGMMEGSVGL